MLLVHSQAQQRYSETKIWQLILQHKVATVFQRSFCFSNETASRDDKFFPLMMKKLSFQLHNLEVPLSDAKPTHFKCYSFSREELSQSLPAIYYKSMTGLHLWPSIITLFLHETASRNGRLNSSKLRNNATWMKVTKFLYLQRNFVT